MQRPFRQVDVFTTVPYRGNPVAVVLDGRDLETEQMQRFAHWTNLSETTFVLPPNDPAADYRLRIFTPVAELPFAGHPTLGTCHAWLSGGGVPARDDLIVQECNAGLISHPPHRCQDSPLQRRRSCGAARSRTISSTRSRPSCASSARRSSTRSGRTTGRAGWPCCSRTPMRCSRSSPATPSSTSASSGRIPRARRRRSRCAAFFPKDGALVEDPVTGSLNASLAEWLLRSGRATAPYVASQGTVLGRAGRVHISQDPDGTIWVGGGTVTCVSGEVELASHARASLP